MRLQGLSGNQRCTALISLSTGPASKSWSKAGPTGLSLNGRAASLPLRLDPSSASLSQADRNWRREGRNQRTLGSAPGGRPAARVFQAVRPGNSGLAHAAAAHPQALGPLYQLYAFACVVERTWRFGLPLVLAHMPGGFQAVALLGFASPLASSILVPALGQILDRTYRPYGLGAMVALQDLSILASCAALVAATKQTAAASLVDSPVFSLLLVLSMVERLSAALSEMLIERDWVPQIAGKHNAQALSSCNANLKRTDLVCELVGSLAFGWVYSQAGMLVSMAMVSLVAVVALSMQFHSIYKIAQQAPGAMVHGREDLKRALFKPQWKQLLPGHHTLLQQEQQHAQQGRQHGHKAKSVWRRLEEQISHSLDGWKVYLRQPIMPSSIAYVLLFLNVVLSPVGLIFPFLSSWGMGGMASAIFKGGCAVMGFLGTWVGKHMIQTVGLLKAGQNALMLQVLLLTAATALYFGFLSGPPQLGISGTFLAGGGAAAASTLFGIPLPVVAFAALVVLSRCGVWSYELVNAQLFQQTVPQREMSSASSAEMALCSFAEVSMLGIAAYSADASSFGKLVCGSLGAVVLAAAIYTAWARHAEQGGAVHATAAA